MLSTSRRRLGSSLDIMLTGLFHRRCFGFSGSGCGVWLRRLYRRNHNREHLFHDLRHGFRDRLPDDLGNVRHVGALPSDRREHLVKDPALKLLGFGEPAVRDEAVEVALRDDLDFLFSSSSKDSVFLPTPYNVMQLHLPDAYT